MDWQLLLPNNWNPINAIHLLYSNESQIASQALSALFIHAILAIAFIFLTWVLVLTVRSIFKTVMYTKNLPKDKNSIKLNESTKLPLFKDWNELLVRIEHKDGSSRASFRRVVSAVEIFKDDILGPNLTKYRIFVAMPGILTGVGVLGTFVGLQIGMGGLDLSDARELDKSIIPLIQGCVIAFSTSVWGVLSSVIFSFLEKNFEGLALWRIRSLQYRVDSLYLPYLPEETLMSIEGSSIGTEEILKGLAVAIGNEMQKAIGRLGNEIKDAVATATSEGQDSLMEKSAELLSETVTRELQNLTNQINDMGDKFQTQFSSASGNLVQSVDSFQPTIEKLSQVVNVADQNVTNAVEKLNAHESVMDQMAKAAVEVKQAAKNFSNMKETFQISSDNNKKAADAQLSASDANIKVAEQFDVVSEKLPAVQETLDNAAIVITSFGDPIRELKDYLERFPASQEQIEKNRSASENERNNRLLEMTGELAEKVGVAAEQFAQVSSLADNLGQSATILNDVSNELATFGNNVLEASKVQKDSSAASLSAATAGERTANAFESITSKIDKLTIELDVAGEKMGEGASKSIGFYEKLIELQDKWYQGAELGLTAMKDRLNSIIQAYGQQIEGNTKNLMKQWTDEVTNCLRTYQSQVDQLQEELDALQETLTELIQR